MTKTVYNIEKLQNTGELDANEALANFANARAYTKAYAAFLDNSPKHLQYLPDVVVLIEDTRNEVIAEVKALQKDLIRLGMKKTADMLDDLVESANSGDANGVSDRMVQYRAHLEVYRRAADAAAETADVNPVVLTVDDMPEILAEIKSILAPDYDVIATADAKHALSAAELHVPDVFLFDIEMPEESGVSLAQTLRGKYLFAQTPIFFLTSSASREHVISAKELHSKGYILKPVNAADLKKRLAALF